jgi:phosphoglycolate phosphatase-like HAD superfamily hydrolase
VILKDSVHELNAAKAAKIKAVGIKMCTIKVLLMSM